MDNAACAKELLEAINLLHDDNIVMAEHTISNVLLKVRAELKARVQDRITLWESEAFKRMQLDPEGRRIHPSKPNAKANGAKKPKAAKRPRTTWIDEVL